MSKRKCRYCGERKPKEDMFITPLAAFCNADHAFKYANENKQKEYEKQKAKKDREFRAETRKRKEQIKTKSDWAKELQVLVNRCVRLRDSKLGCVSCDKPANWNGQWHASHFYSVGHSSFLRFNLWNIHKSCSICNNWLSGNIDSYRPRLIEKEGEDKVDWLDRNAKNLCKRDVDWYKRAIKIARKAVKRYEKRL